MKRLLTYTILLVALTICSSSCESNIEYATEYGFSLHHDDYRLEHHYGESIRVKMYIKEKNDLEDNYYIVKYFSPKGEGTAYYGDDYKKLTPNENIYLTLKKDSETQEKVFVFMYIPSSSGDHECVLTIRDSYGNERQEKLQFHVQQ